VLIPRTVDIARARIITKAYQQSEGENQAIRRAKAMSMLLCEMPIHILKGELIVGNQGEKPRAGPVFPEYQWELSMNEMDDWPTRPGDRFFITPEQSKELKEILTYWKGRTVRDRVYATLPQEIKTSLHMGVISNANYMMSGHGHFVPDYENILEIGLAGVRAQIEQNMDALDSRSTDYYHKVSFYKGALIMLDAIVAFAERFAVLAEEFAAKESSPQRKKELFRIAANCRWVPANPARDYWEALQLVWFMALVPQIEANGLAVCFGRMDQYIYPYYTKGLEDGSLTRDAALEILDCFYVKSSTINKIYSNEGAMIFAGPGLGQTITIAGVTKEGLDATNEMSYLCMEADDEVRLMQPDIAVRLHPRMPEQFLQKVCRHAASGRDKPKFFNDLVGIASLMGCGCTLEDARDYADLGCSELIVPGKTCSGGNHGNICLAKCFELALADGVVNWCYDGKEFHRNEGVKTGEATGDPRKFSSYGDVWNAYTKQVEHFMEHIAIMDNIIDNVQAELVPLLSNSLLTEGCIESGVDFTAGGAVYNYTSPVAVGPITAADSLASVKKLVFDEKKLTMGVLVDAINANFEGAENERLREMMINRAPKFGNDDPYVDDIARQVIKQFADSMKPFKNPRGGEYVAGVYSLTGNVGFGWRTGPTPDGRKGGDLLNDNISPMQGRDFNGPTAVIKSLSNVDSSKLPQGYVFNMKFNPDIIKDERKIQKFIDFNRALMDFGIFHIQYNILDAAMLRAAQKEPEKYRSLLVRVSGYSAYFIELSKGVQDHLIQRTEHYMT